MRKRKGTVNDPVDKLLNLVPVLVGSFIVMTLNALGLLSEVPAIFKYPAGIALAYIGQELILRAAVNREKKSGKQ